MKIKSSYIVILLILAFIPAIWGIFHAGFFVSDDGSSMVIRLSAFYEAVTSLQFPVRFLPRLSQGIGYPVADFLYPLFLYIGALIHIFRVPFLLDIKIILAASVIFSGVGMYLFLKKYVSVLPAFLGGLCYVYVPYHLYDLYSRGSVGEIVALAVAPFLFWVAARKSWKLLGFFIFLLILAHNTLAVFFLPIVLIFAYVDGMKLQKIIYSLCIGLGLASFFWIPALYDKQFTVFDATSVAASASPYFINHMSYYLLGWISLVIFGGVFFFSRVVREKNIIFFFLLGLVSLFFSLSVSSFLWQGKLLIEFVQFPFRFLSLFIFAESVLAAYVLEHIQKQKILVILFILLLGFSALPYLFPKAYEYQPESFYDTNVSSTTTQNEYTPIWVKQTPPSYMYTRVSSPNKNVTLSNVLQKGTDISFTAVAQKESTIVISFAYFPGWKVLVDGKQVSITPSRPAGLIQLSVVPGSHQVRAYFAETPVRLFADILSLLAGLALIGSFILVKRKYDTK